MVSEETFLSQERIFSAGTNCLALLLEGIIVNCDITEVLLGGCKTVILTSTDLSLHPQSHWLKPESLLIQVTHSLGHSIIHSGDTSN